MFGFLRFWKWRIFHRKKKVVEEAPIDNASEAKTSPIEPPIPLDVKPTLYPSRNMALITTESDLKLRPITVLDDHMIEYNKKKVRIKYDRPAHIIDLNLHDLMPTKKQRILCKLFGIPKYQTYRAYTFQAEGEITHDPHPDGLGEMQKMRFEKLIQLEAVAVKAAIAANIMAGLKDKSIWWEKLGPMIIIALIVAFFLFAFQIQPNL